MIRNAAARLLVHSSKQSHILFSLLWLTDNFRIHFVIVILTKQVLNGQTLNYIPKPCVTHTARPLYLLTSSKCISCLHTSLKTRADRSFQSVAPCTTTVTSSNVTVPLTTTQGCLSLNESRKKMEYKHMSAMVGSAVLQYSDVRINGSITASLKPDGVSTPV